MNRQMRLKIREGFAEVRVQTVDILRGSDVRIHISTDQ
jgi:hypothetical protein